MDLLPIPRIESLPISIEDPKPGSHAIQCSKIRSDFKRYFQVWEPLRGNLLILLVVHFHIFFKMFLTYDALLIFVWWNGQVIFETFCIFWSICWSYMTTKFDVLFHALNEFAFEDFLNRWVKSIIYMHYAPTCFHVVPNVFIFMLKLLYSNHILQFKFITRITRSLILSMSMRLDTRSVWDIYLYQ